MPASKLLNHNMSTSANQHEWLPTMAAIALPTKDSNKCKRQTTRNTSTPPHDELRSNNSSYTTQSDS